MGYRFKVVRVDRLANMMPELTSVGEESAELAAVNAEVVFLDSNDEAEINKSVRDADAIITTVLFVHQVPSPGQFFFLCKKGDTDQSMDCQQKGTH